jgi:hypothetical protein
VLAEVATIRRVREVIRILKLRRLHHAHGNLKLRRNVERVGQFAAGQTRGIRDHRQRFVSQNVSRHPREEHGIDSTRVGHETRPERANQLAQLFQFVCRHKRTLPLTPKDVEPGSSGEFGSPRLAQTGAPVSDPAFGLQQIA